MDRKITFIALLILLSSNIISFTLGCVIGYKQGYKDSTIDCMIDSSREFPEMVRTIKKMVCP